MPSGSYWSEEEEEILRSLWSNKKLSIDLMSEIMGRSIPSIKTKTKNMGLENREALEALWRVEDIKRRMAEVIEA